MPTDSQKPMEAPKKANGPTRAFRIFSLLLVPIYLYLISVGIAVATKSSLWLTSPLVLLSAFVIMAVLVVFGLRSLDAKPGSRSFGISTIMLIMVPLSFYFAAFRLITQDLPWDDIPWFGFAMIGVLAVLAMAVTTVLLLAWAEAIAWVAVGCLKSFRKGMASEK